MLCYKDRTFCIAKCATELCDGKLTEKIRRDAIAWWGGESAPIMMNDLSKICADFTRMRNGDENSAR